MLNTDKAWNRLYARLADEQLLVPDDAKTVTVPFITKMKWAAAIIILCICGGAAYLYLFPAKETGQIFTLHNNEASITLVSALDDGSIVYLTNGATLACPEHFAADKRQVTLQGEALFDIRSDKNCPFLIETEPVLVEVLGTTFNIKSDGCGSCELSVQHGLVEVTVKATGAQTLVEAGETALLDANRQLLKEQTHGWQQLNKYTQKMRFKDEQLGNIVHVINKISEKPIVFSDSALKSRELTITFDNNTVREMVELLCIGLDLTCADDGNVIVIDL